jgi:arylsulfatase
MLAPEHALTKVAARFLQTMLDYPPSPHPGSFNLSSIKAQIEGSLGAR